MALSININSNLSQVISKLGNNLDILKNPEYLFRQTCFDLIDLMTERIHIKGLNVQDQPMGTYSPQYLKLRQQKYNRKADNKVIISLTRQLENDWSVIPTDRGYGIGFLNAFNFQKSQWVEGIYGPIFSLTFSEEQYAFQSIGEQITKALNDKGNS